MGDLGGYYCSKEAQESIKTLIAMVTVFHIFPLFILLSNVLFEDKPIMITEYNSGIVDYVNQDVIPIVRDLHKNSLDRKCAIFNASHSKYDKLYERNPKSH